MKIIKEKRLIGVEDINWDSTGAGESQDFTTPDGAVNPLRKVNASHLPVTQGTASALSGATTVDRALIALNAKIAQAETNAAMTRDTVIVIDVSSSYGDIQQLVSSQPRNLGGHSLTFKFPDSTTFTFSQPVTFSGFHNGTLALSGTSTRFDCSGIDGVFLFQGISCPVTVGSYNINISQRGSYGIKILSCASVNLTDCVFTGTTLTGTVGVLLDTSDGVFTGCTYAVETPVEVRGNKVSLVQDAADNALSAAHEAKAAADLNRQEISTINTTKADKSIPIVKLTGNAVTVSPERAYEWDINEAGTMNLSGWTEGTQQHATAHIRIGTSGSVTGGNNLKIVDTLYPGEECFVALVGMGGQVRMYLIESTSLTEETA